MNTAIHRSFTLYFTNDEWKTLKPSCRELGARVTNVHANKIRPMRIEDFQVAMTSIRPSVSEERLRGVEEWAREYGTNAWGWEVSCADREAAVNKLPMCNAGLE